MKIHNSPIRVFLAAAFASLLVGAAPPRSYEAGTLLSSEQLASLEVKSSVTIDGRVFRVVRTEPVSQGKTKTGDVLTTVVNDRGVVGTCLTEVLVSLARPEAVTAQVKGLGLKPVSTVVAEATGLTSIRFASLADAVEARKRLMGALPKARVDVPMEFSTRRAR
jgi:hypothetical protein